MAFVGNGSGAISSYSVSPTSGVTLLNATAATEPGVKTGIGSVAADSWVSADGKSIVVSAGTKSGMIMSFPVNADGTLGTVVTNSSLATPFAGAFLLAQTTPYYLSTSTSLASLTEFSDSNGTLTSIGNASTGSAPSVATPC